jgi:anti-sigma regulatory factor (Ser/Thr protein kinase)
MPQNPVTKVLSLDLPCAPDAPATVRAALRGTGGQSDDVLLVASELVTNAVEHSGCEPDDLLNVRISEQSERILISVCDPGTSNRRAAVGPAEPSRVGGWGLRLVAQLSERWGADRPGGYRVWAEVAVAR